MSSHPYTENGFRGALAWGETNHFAIKAMDSRGYLERTPSQTTRTNALIDKPNARCRSKENELVRLPNPMCRLASHERPCRSIQSCPFPFSRFLLSRRPSPLVPVPRSFVRDIEHLQRKE